MRPGASVHNWFWALFGAVIGVFLAVHKAYSGGFSGQIGGNFASSEAGLGPKTAPSLTEKGDLQRAQRKSALVTFIPMRRPQFGHRVSRCGVTFSGVTTECQLRASPWPPRASLARAYQLARRAAHG
jgi:hypothetical protein